MPGDDDPGPFDGVAEYYASHRPGYGEDAVAFLVERFGLDASARVLDLGCGAGQLTVPLAAHAGEVVGVDPDEAMLAKARERADAAGVSVEWVVGSDADLDGSIGPLRLTTMGRSFHWMDEARTLDRLHAATEPGGGVAILTDREWLTKGREEWGADVHAVVADYVTDPPERVDPDDLVYDDPWDEKLAEHGFDAVAVDTFDVEREWTVDGVVGYVRSLSFCSPDELGDPSAFERDVRARLADRGGGPFAQATAVEVISGRA